MKALFTAFFIILVTFLVTGCDPGKILIIKTDNKENAAVSVYTNNSILPRNDRSDSSKLVIRVPDNDSTSKAFYYGIGNWPLESINGLAANIDSIVFVNSAGKQVLAAKDDILAYLKKSRGGYAGSRLTIQAKAAK